MSILRLAFAGTVHKIEHKTAGGKSLCEISLCKKNYAKQGDEVKFTWIRIALWDAPDWMIARLAKDVFIAGSGDFQTRSFTDKDGSNRTSAEVRCSSFDIEVGGLIQREEKADLPPRSTARVAPIVGGADESMPPF